MKYNGETKVFSINGMKSWEGHMDMCHDPFLTPYTIINSIGDTNVKLKL